MLERVDANYFLFAKWLGGSTQKRRAVPDWIGLNLLEIALAFPIGDGGIESRLLDLKEVRVVGSHFGAERFTDEVAGLKDFRGLAQGCGDGRQGLRGVGIACEERGRFDLVGDAVEAGGQGRSKAEVRVAVGSR